MLLAPLDHCLCPPCLMKVKAHDVASIQCGDVRACGNAQADSAAKDATIASSTVYAYVPDDRFGDAMRVRSSDGHWVVDLNSAIKSY